MKNYSSIPYNIYNKKSKSLPTSNSTNDIFIINYESLFSREKNLKKALSLRQSVSDFLSSCKNANVSIIIDESHKCKDYSSNQTKSILMMQKILNQTANSLHTYLLTGTPFTQGFIDTWCQLKMLGCPMTKESFIENFCIKGSIRGLLPWMQPIVAYKNVKQLYDLIHSYAITIESTDVIKLPEMVFDRVVLPFSEEVRLQTSERYKAERILEICVDRSIPLDTDFWKVPTDLSRNMPNPFYRNLAYPENKWAADTTATNWLRTRQLSIGFLGNEEEAIWYNRDRLNRLEKFLIENEDNYILFYNFTPELVEIYEICKKLDYKIDIYAGGTLKSTPFYNEYEKMDEGKRLVNKKRILIANWASGGTGKNFQAYNKTIIFSLPVYSFWTQGLKRTNRIGQKNTTIYYIFMQNNFLDKSMLKAINEGVEYNKDMFESDLKKEQILLDKQ